MPSISFPDYPEFRPNLTPRDIFRLGSFGGTYWRPIHSTVTKRDHKNAHLKYPKSWWKGIPDDWLVTPWDEYDKTVNRYGVKVGTTLQEWEAAGWIESSHPYGWVQWYCDFYAGTRGPDDERQIRRWVQTVGPNSRFRKRLASMVRAGSGNYADKEISPKIRQTLQHWGVVLTRADVERAS